MHARVAEVGLAGGIGGDLVADTFKLAAADVFEILALRGGSRGFVEIDRDLKAAGDFGADMTGHGDAVFEGDAVDGDERNDVGCAHAWVRPWCRVRSMSSAALPTPRMAAS